MTNLLAETRRALADAADPAFRTGMMAYFREPIDAYGVRGPAVKAIARDVYRALKPQSEAARTRFYTELWKSGKMEEGGIVCDVCRRFARAAGPAEFRLYERWLNRYVRNWAHCDGVSAWLLGACVANHPDLAAALPAWTRSRNRWKRRAAAVSLVYEAKAGRSTARILEIAELLIDDPDDMVRKGLGWLLKETYPKRPREVVAFLLAHPAAPRLTVRYAAEKMSPTDREKVMRRTI